MDEAKLASLGQPKEAVPTAKPAAAEPKAAPVDLTKANEKLSSLLGGKPEEKPKE